MSKIADAYIDLRARDSRFGPDMAAFKSRFTGMLQGIASTAGGILASIGISSLAGSVANIGRSFITANSQYEQYTIALGVMLGSQQKAVATMKQIETMAARTPFSTSSLLSAFQSLKMYGFEAEAILPMLKNIGDAAAASPEGMEAGVGRISWALGQMKAAGKVMRQDLYQLINAGIPVWDILASESGKSVQEVQGMITSATLSSEDAIRMLLAGMGKRFGGMMDKQSRSWAGMWSTIMDTATIASRKIGKPLFDALSSGVAKMLAYLESPTGQNMIDNLAIGMKVLVEVIGRASVAVVAFARGPIGQAILGFAKWVAIGAVAIGAFLAIKAALLAIVPVVALLLNPISLVTAALVGGVAAWAKYTEAGRAFVDWFGSRFGQMMKDVGGALKLDDLDMAVKLLFANLKVAFLEGIVALTEAVGGEWGQFIGKLGTDIASGNISAAWDTLTIGMAEAWQSSMDAIQDAWHETKRFILDGLAVIKKNIASWLVKSGIMDFLPSHWEQVKEAQKAEDAQAKREGRQPRNMQAVLQRMMLGTLEDDMVRDVGAREQKNAERKRKLEEAAEQRRKKMLRDLGVSPADPTGGAGDALAGAKGDLDKQRAELEAAAKSDRIFRAFKAGLDNKGLDPNAGAGAKRGDASAVKFGSSGLAEMNKAVQKSIQGEKKKEKVQEDQLKVQQKIKEGIDNEVVQLEKMNAMLEALGGYAP